MFGNVNVDYKPCKSVSQLRRACNYILGRNPEQVAKGVVKTADNLYFAFDGNRDNFAEDVLLTRRLWKKSIDGKKNNLAYKMSISFHPDDNEKISYEEAFRIAGRFAEKYFHSKNNIIFYTFRIYIFGKEFPVIMRKTSLALTHRNCFRTHIIHTP